MLGSPSPAAASLFTAPASASPTSNTRVGRLRAFSYLRSHTHNHIQSERPATLSRSTSSPAPDTPAANSPVRDSEREETAGAAPSATIQSGENGWIPTIQGRSGLDRESPHPTSTSIESASLEPNSGAVGMTRSRAVTTLGPTPTTGHPLARRQSAVEGLSGMDPFASPTPPANSHSSSSRDPLPAIRFIPHVESRSSRPSLQFPAVSRTLKTANSIIRVGRYSERDNNSGDQSLLPVGFKSKVVSRRHCEFWCTDGQWYIKDVKSSSGTFLNHVRLSSPGSESRPFPVNDGDVVQLGIDFKGGEEIIFRCVKIRVECNRSWQKGLNNFNTSAHKRLFKNALKPQQQRDSDAASVNSSECSICLNPVSPCQALFVAPCSHVWHYKCIRNLLTGPTSPNFLCPNCRYVADLDADVEQPEDEIWEDDFADEKENESSSAAAAAPSSIPGDEDDDDDDKPQATPDPSSEDDSTTDPTPSARSTHPSVTTTDDDDLASLMSHTSLAVPPAVPSRAAPGLPTTTSTAAIPIPHSSRPAAASSEALLAPRSATPTTNAPFSLSAGVMTDGLMTPRNDAGPFVFDGGAGRRSSGSSRGAAEEEVGAPRT